ncbi:hypothetical protein [Pseudomonas sp. NPDC089547]|uniref:hypothetical protein n=1 Tax=Pseudomonas sp. NPDC089547 TaxID=3390652 RepID=UPI003CFE12E6
MPESIEQPAPLALGRWLLGAGLAMLACLLILVLHGAGHLAQLQALNVWLLACLPWGVWLLMFGTRAYMYGGQLNHHRFVHEQMQVAQLSWQNWAQRHIAVLASCVVMPDDVSAVTLMQSAAKLASRSGQARRISFLAQAPAPAIAGLKALLSGLSTALKGLPERPKLCLTILTDVEPAQYEALRDTWHQYWANATAKPQLSELHVVADLSYEWVSEIVKAGSSDFSLVLVLQTQGGASYSDGLAGLLVCPDHLARDSGLPVRGALLRPMPLDIGAAVSEIELFFKTQTAACQASSLLADSVAWASVVGTVLSMDQSPGLDHEKSWIQQRVCGLPGPFSPWLLAALSVEIVQHQQRPLLMLAEQGQQYWISTATTGGPA